MSTSPTGPASPASSATPTSSSAPALSPSSTTETPADNAACAAPTTAAESASKTAPVAASRQPVVAQQTTRSRAITLAAVAAIAVAVIALPRHLAPAQTPGTADPRPEANERPMSTDRELPAQPSVPTSAAARAAASAPVAAPSVHVDAATGAGSESRGRTPAKPVRNAAATPSSRVATESSTRGPTAREVVENADRAGSVAAPAHAEPTATPPAPAASTETAAAYAPVTTITGCLEVSVDGDRFRLADTEGTNAPKARSWRTGFLKKRPVAVEIVGNPEALALRQQVGKRIAATGVQTSRELEISSLRVVSPSCD